MACLKGLFSLNNIPSSPKNLSVPMVQSKAYHKGCAEKNAYKAQ